MRRLVLLALVLLPFGASAQTATTSQPTAQTVIVCVPSTTGVAISPCDVTGQVMMPSYVSGYVLSATDYQSLQASTAPFDATLGAQYFSMGAGIVISCWLLTFACGLVFQAVRG